MSIRITIPGGITIEADTLAEALAVARAVSPHTLETIETEAVKATRTRLMVTNGDLDVLDAWGLSNGEMRESLDATDWAVLAKELRRTVSGAESVVRRYLWGVYEHNGSDPSVTATIRREKDRSPPRSQV